eukprot:5419669-Ditylum_brightwellii.AAC.1
MLYLLKMTLLCDRVRKIFGMYMELFLRKTALGECLNDDSCKSLQESVGEAVGMTDSIVQSEMEESMLLPGAVSVPRLCCLLEAKDAHNVLDWKVNE